MFIKKNSNKKNFLFNVFTKIYFLLTLILFIVVITFFFNTGLWTNNKKDILHRTYFNGINHYPKIFEILIKGSNFFLYDYDDKFAI